MDDTAGILIAIAIGAAIVAALFLLMIPQPDERAVITMERLDVAVLRFGNSSSWPKAGETLRARIEAKLVNTSGITVFSRTRLEELVTEHVLGKIGLVDPNTAARIGSLTGVNKLLTGEIYGVEAGTEETTVCEEWKDGDCIQSVPATRYTVGVLGQVEVLNAQTGQIEQAEGVEGSASTIVKQGNTFAGYESLIAESADEISSEVSSLLTATYTRELRYGLYRSYETKRNGYVGQGETTHFSHIDEAYLIVHFTRVKTDDAFQLVWVGPEGNIVKKEDDIVRDGAWRLYRLELAGLSNGRFTIKGTLNGIEAFEKGFILDS
ncbi:MAG: CsgG/HfaB family protein [Candidatus Bipolaricaulota bacterium]|nr:CsgG/HfaB family protein [Candidatus Bipolaricaulota bacterium]